MEKLAVLKPYSAFILFEFSKVSLDINPGKKSARVYSLNKAYQYLVRYPFAVTTFWHLEAIESTIFFNVSVAILDVSYFNLEYRF